MPASLTGQKTRHEAELPPLLRLFQFWTILLLAVSFLFHLIEHARRRPGFQRNPLSPPAERFGDFTIFWSKYKSFHTPTFFKLGFPINYPAPCSDLFEIFFGFFTHPVRMFFISSLLCFLIPAALFGRTLYRRGISAWKVILFMVVITSMSWPIVLLIDRGNIEVFVWAALATGMWAYATGRLWVASTFFGIGASLKLFPFVLLGLFLSRRQYSKVLWGLFVFVGVSILGLAILGPTIPQAYAGINAGLASFKLHYMGEWHVSENGVDHSVFALLKGLAILLFHHDPHHFGRSLTAFLAISAITGLLLYFLRIRKLPLLNQIFALTIASIYFTAFSGDGTLVHLYSPCAMAFLLAIQAYRDRVEIPGLKLVIGCLVFILSFETFLILGQQRIIGQAHCIAIGVLLYAVLRYPLGPSLEATRSETILSQPATAWVTKTLIT
jgi:hypothetical protein